MRIKFRKMSRIDRKKKDYTKREQTEIVPDIKKLRRSGAESQGGPDGCPPGMSMKKLCVFK